MPTAARPVASPAGLLLLRRNPPINLRIEHRQRNRAVLEHLGVEFANVEAIAERLFGALAHFLDLQLADLVGQRLRRDRDVALGLGDRLCFRLDSSQRRNGAPRRYF